MSLSWIVFCVFVLFCSVALVVILIVDHRAHNLRVKAIREEQTSVIDQIVIAISEAETFISNLEKNLKEIQSTRARMTHHTGAYLEVQLREMDLKRKISFKSEELKSLKEDLFGLVDVVGDGVLLNAPTGVSDGSK